MNTQEKNMEQAAGKQDEKGFVDGVREFFSKRLGRKIRRAQAIVGILTPGCRRKRSMSEAAERRARRESGSWHVLDPQG